MELLQFTWDEKLTKNTHSIMRTEINLLKLNLSSIRYLSFNINVGNSQINVSVLKVQTILFLQIDWSTFSDACIDHQCLDYGKC